MTRSLPAPQVGDGGGVAAAQRGGDRLGGQGVALVGGVEGGAEVVVDLDGLGVATGGAALGDGRSRRPDGSTHVMKWWRRKPARPVDTDPDLAHIRQELSVTPAAG